MQNMHYATRDVRDLALAMWIVHACETIYYFHFETLYVSCVLVSASNNVHVVVYKQMV